MTDASSGPVGPVHVHQKNMKVLGGVEEGLIFSCGRGMLFDYDYD